LDLGVGEEKIRVFGIPFDPDFAKGHDRALLADKLGIDGKKFTVLLITGSFGSGPLEEIAKRLCGFAQVLVVCAKNNSLFRRLTRRNLENVKVFGFVNNAEELMAVSDIIITKPGGITTAEALARGLPMLIVNPLPGQEAMNTKFLLNEGVAVRGQNPADVVVVLEELLYNKNKLKIMSDKAKSLSKPDSAGSIARLMLEIAK